MEILNKSLFELENQLDKEISVYKFLSDLGIEYQKVDHEPAYTMEDCQKIDSILSVKMCKNLFLCNRQKTNFYLLLMPDNKKFVTKDLSNELGVSRLSFAQEQYMIKFLNITSGAVSVMGLINDKQNQVKLLIDADLLKDEYLGCHPCVNTSSIKIKIEDLKKFLLAIEHEYQIVHL